MFCETLLALSNLCENFCAPLRGKIIANIFQESWLVNSPDFAFISIWNTTILEFLNYDC